MRAKELFAIIRVGGVGGGSGEPYLGGNTEDRFSFHEAKISFQGFGNLLVENPTALLWSNILCAN